MDDLISREWLKKRMTFEPDYEAVLMAPKVDAVPVRHGRWNTSLDGITPFCTACCMKHKMTNCMKIPNYCPNCGAKMDGGEENAAD